MGVLRFLLATAVITGHTVPILGVNLVGGMTAVESFFMISGFYMSLVLHEKYNKGDNSYRFFLTNRFLRLYPMYWAVFLLVILFSLYLQFKGIGNHFTSFITHFHHMNIFTLVYLIFTNIFLFGQDTLFFMSLNPENGSMFFTRQYTSEPIWLASFLFIPPAWTIGIELMFYLIAPFIFKKGWKFILTVFIISFLIKISLYAGGLNFEPWPYRFLPAEIFFFLAGYFSYLLYKKIKIKKNPPKFLWGIYILLILLTIFFSRIPGINLYSYNSYRVGYYLLLFFAIPYLFTLTKKSSLDNFIGRLSYPMYISHFSIIEIFFLYNQSFAFKNPNYGIVILILTVIVSLILLFVVDNRVQKWKVDPKLVQKAEKK
jgi:peptidoglycan/LPS O-acetylase OafA/YrhL